MEDQDRDPGAYSADAGGLPDSETVPVRLNPGTGGAAPAGDLFAFLHAMYLQEITNSTTERGRMASSSGGQAYPIVNRTWFMLDCIGKGSFCELFWAENLQEFDFGPNSHVAIKLQTTKTTSSVIKHEAELLRTLSGLDTVPQYIDHGRHEGLEYLVMELLGGEDMSNLRDRIRRQCGARLIPLPLAVYFIKQMLLCLKDLHSRGMVHRDVKPANFVRKSKDSTSFCVIDFGLTRQFLDSEGNLIPKRDNVDFRGTTMYASPKTLEGEEQCPRDDLYGMILVLCDFICGSLPWAVASRDKDKPEVARLKHQYLDDPNNLINYVKSTAQAEARARSDKDLLRSSEVQGKWPFGPEYDPFPQRARTAMLDILHYLTDLQYEDIRPDYLRIEQGLDAMALAFDPDVYESSTGQTSHIEEHHDASDSAYSCLGSFSWHKGATTLPSRTGPLTIDDVDQHEVIRIKAEHLATCFDEALNTDPTSTVDDDDSISTARDSGVKVSGALSDLARTPQRLMRAWKSLQSELLGMENTSVIQIETIEYMKRMAKLADYFYGGVPVGGSAEVPAAEWERHEQDWREFVSIQKTLNDLLKLEKRVKRRMNSTGGLQLARRPSSSNFSASIKKIKKGGDGANSSASAAPHKKMKLE